MIKKIFLMKIIEICLDLDHTDLLELEIISKWWIVLNITKNY